MSSMDEDSLTDIKIKCENISGDYETVYLMNDEEEYEDNSSYNIITTNPTQNQVYQKFEELDLLGYRFGSLQEVINFMSQFEEHSGNKFWKRSTRTIKGAHVKRQINKNLFYYEIKYTCIHGGLAFKSRSKGIRKTSSNKMGCPSQITFRASDDGQYLRIINLNLKHEGHFGTKVVNNTKQPSNEGSDSDQEELDDWDDTALIKAYDKATNLAKEEITKRLNEGDQSCNIKITKTAPIPSENILKKPKQWSVGDFCRAVYSEDGEIYEATIIEINDDKNSCTIEYLGYGNFETINLNTLLESAGAGGRRAQIEATKAENEPQEPQCNGSNRNEMEFEDHPSSAFTYEPLSMNMPPAPPLPPQLMAKLPNNDSDALSSMLMSWYVSGFHTGYYHGLKQARENKGRNNR